MIPLLVAKSGTVCFSFPDVCLTPTPTGPMPIPYPNIATGNNGSGSRKVRFRGSYSFLRKGDAIRLSSGDEAGSLGNVVSKRIKGKTQVMAGWPTVRIEGRQPGFQCVPTGQNGGSPSGSIGAGVKTDNSAVGVAPSPPGFEHIDRALQVLKNCLPEVYQELQKLLKDKWTIEPKRMMADARVNPITKKIFISTSRTSPGIIARGLTHEIGHVTSPYNRIRGNRSRQVFLRRATKDSMKSEGYAVLYELTKMKEWKKFSETEKGKARGCPEALRQAGALSYNMIDWGLQKDLDKILATPGLSKSAMARRLAQRIAPYYKEDYGKIGLRILRDHPNAFKFKKF